MKLRDILFWVFAILQGFFILELLWDLKIISGLVINAILLVISLIGIEYLIYSKK